MEHKVLDTIYKSQLPDNSVRSQAESDFLSLAASDPSAIAYTLVDVSMNSTLEPAARQTALLYLKRIVLFHWSLGFESFVGNPITTDTKAYIRSALLSSVAAAPTSKIRNALANIIVTISLVDYPDEWPDLLSLLYSFIDTSSSSVSRTSLVGGLLVLQELFDELITDEQFFEGGVGTSTLNYCVGLLSAPTVPIVGAAASTNFHQNNVPLGIKNQVAKLFEIALRQLQGPDVFSNPNRAQVAAELLPKALSLTLDLLKQQFNYSSEILSTGVNVLNVENMLFVHKVYEILTFLVDSFNKKLFTPELKYLLQEITIKHLANLNSFYKNMFIVSSDKKDIEKFIVHLAKADAGADADAEDPERALNNLLTQMTQLLGSLSDCPVSQKPESLNLLLNNFLTLNTIPYETYELYVDNFNQFVTEETEMSGNFTVRNSVRDYLSEVQSQDSVAMLTAALSMLLSKDFGFHDWREKESILNMLEAIFLNEDDIDTLPGNLSFESVLEALISFSNNKKSNPLVIARTVLVLAKFLEKFGTNVPDFNALSYKVLINNLNIAANTTNDNIIQSEGVIDDDNIDKESSDTTKVIQSAALISLTYFNNFLKFNDTSLNHEIQNVIHQIMLVLVDEAEEDTPAVLLEALTISINVDLKHAQTSTKDITLIFRIAGVDFSNVMNVQTAKDSLETLLANISDDDYLKQCEFGLPSLVGILNEGINTSGSEYSPKLNMALELLNVFIEGCPSQHDLPASLFNYIFAPLSNLLVQAADDQILQIGGEVFNTILVNSSEEYFLRYENSANENGIQILLKILEKFLSPALSDSAAMNVGSIVVSIVQKFNEQLSRYIPQILESATRRLLIAQHAIIIENLIMVFCYLVILSEDETLNFLASLKFEMAAQPQPSFTTPDGSFDGSAASAKTTKNGIDVVLPIWLDSFTTTRGYDKIKQNVLALGKLFLLNDERMNAVIVRGDIIPNQSSPDLIITRSMAKKMPTTYTQVSAPLKILKLFIQELNFQQQQPNPSEYMNKVDDTATGGDDGWEDLDDVGVPSLSKLQSYVDDNQPSKDLGDQASEDLKTVLVNFLKHAIQGNSDQFGKYYEQLDDNEKKTLAETLGF